MGIREVMVIVGGKSVGDVVELLGRRLAFRARPDLSLPARRAGHRPRHRPGPRLRRRRGVLLRPRRQHPAAAPPLADVAARVRGRAVAAPGRCSTGCPIRSGSAWPSSTPHGNVVGFEEKPAEPKSDLIPIGVYFLRPGRVRRRSTTSPRPAAASSRSPTCSTTTSPTAACTPSVYDGHWTDAGTVAVAAARRRARRRGRRRRPARRPAAPAAGTLTARDDRPPSARSRRAPARDRRRRLHRIVLRARRPRPRRRHPDHRPRQADLRRQPRPTSQPVEADPEQARPVPLRARRHRRSGGRRAARRRGRRGRQLRRRVARRPLDPRPRGVPADRRHRRPRPARGVPGRAATGAGERAASDPRPAALPPGLAPTRSTARSRPAAPVEDDALAPRSPYSAAKAAGELLVRSYVVTHGVDVVVTRGSNTYGPYQHPEKLIPLFITNAIDDQPLPLYGDGLQRRDWLYVADHAGAIEHVLRHGAARRDVQRPGLGRADQPRGRGGAPASASASPGRWSGTVEDRPGHDRRYAMDGSKLAALGWRNRVGVRRRPARRPSTGSGPTRAGGAAIGPATGTPTTSASTADRLAGSARRRGRSDAPATRRGRLTCGSPSPAAAGRLGRARRGRARRRAVHRARRAARLDPARVRPRRAGQRPPRSSPAIGPRRSSTRRPGPTSTAAPATRSWPCGGTATATGVLADGLRPRPAWT